MFYSTFVLFFVVEIPFITIQIITTSSAGRRVTEFDSSDEKLNIVSLNGDTLDSVICTISTPYPVASASNYSVSIKVHDTIVHSDIHRLKISQMLFIFKSTLIETVQALQTRKMF